MNALISRLINASPVLLAGLCFIAFPVALNPFMNHDGRASLLLASGGSLLDGGSITGAAGDLLPGSPGRVGSIRRRVLSQLGLFAMGLLLMVIAIKF